MTRLSHWLERAPAWLLVGVFVGCGTLVTVAMLRAHDAEGVAPFLLLLGAFVVGAYRPAREVAGAAIAMGVLLVALLVGDVPDFGGVEFAVTAGRVRDRHAHRLDDAVTRDAASRRSSASASRPSVAPPLTNDCASRRRCTTWWRTHSA